MKKVRHFLSVNDLASGEIRAIFKTATEIKRRPALFHDSLRGKTIGLIFEKPSTRTWVSFQVGMTQLGGASIYLGPEDISLGKREAIKDVARALSRYLDAMAIRTYSHERIAEFAEFSGRPVINALSDLSHPCQALTDFFTIEERLGDLGGRKVTYVGDGNNVLHSLLFSAAKLGACFVYATPPAHKPKPDVLREVKALAAKSGATITYASDPREAVDRADVLYTDVWISMGQEKEREEKLKRFEGFQVNRRLLALAKPRALVMHCLPARRGEEITDEVLESPQSIVFDQAENRLHVQKAILLKLIEH